MATTAEAWAPASRETGPVARLFDSKAFLVFLCMLPALGLLLVFLTYPLGLGVWLAFTDTRIGREGIFIGLENFAWLASDRVFWLSVFNTLFYTTVASVLKFGLGLWLALILTLGNLAIAVGQWIVQQAPSWAQQALAWGQALINWIGPMIPLALAALGQLGTSLLAWVGQQAGPLLASFGAWATSIAAWIPGAVTDFLAKPFTMDSLCQAMRALLGRRQVDEGTNALGPP